LSEGKNRAQRLKRYIIAHRLSFFALLCLAIFGIGLSGGFYIVNVYNKNAQILFIGAIVFAIVSWFGSGADILGFFREWRKEIQEEKKMAKLVFEDPPFVLKHEEHQHGTVYKYSTYFLIVRNIALQGMAKDAHTFLYVRGTDILNFLTVWKEDNLQYIPISVAGEVRLFEVLEYNETKEIIFRTRSISEENPLPEFNRLYKKFGNRALSIKLGAENALLPGEYNDTIDNITREAKERQMSDLDESM
jgi:hypothetical protein